MKALQKISPKGMLIIFIVSLFLYLLSPEVAMLIFLVIMVLFVKWLFKPENILLKTRLIWLIIAIPYLILILDIIAFIALSIYTKSFLELISSVGFITIHILSYVPLLKVTEIIYVIFMFSFFAYICYILYDNSTSTKQRTHVIISGGIFLATVCLTGVLGTTLFFVEFGKLA